LDGVGAETRPDGSSTLLAILREDELPKRVWHPSERLGLFQSFLAADLLWSEPAARLVVPVEGTGMVIEMVNRSDDPQMWLEFDKALSRYSWKDAGHEQRHRVSPALSLLPKATPKSTSTKCVRKRFASWIATFAIACRWERSREADMRSKA
jgi:hypothetical protein